MDGDTFALAIFIAIGAIVSAILLLTALIASIFVSVPGPLFAVLGCGPIGVAALIGSFR